MAKASYTLLNNDKMEFEKTVVSISNVVMAKVEDIVYTKTYLETMSTK